MASQVPTFKVAISRAQFDAFNNDEKFKLVQSLIEQLTNLAESTIAAVDRVATASEALGGLLQDTDFLGDKNVLDK